MDDRLAAAVAMLIGPSTDAGAVLELDPFLSAGSDPVARVLAAFLVLAAGSYDPRRPIALEVFDRPGDGPERDVADALRGALERMRGEVLPPRPPVTLDGAEDPVARRRETVWSTTFPQGVGIIGREAERIRELRARRTVTITAPAADPIRDPAREILFTSNVLLTVPAAGTDHATLPYPADLRDAIAASTHEPQRYWYDHPIQIGVDPPANELLYGLFGLDAAVSAEPGGGPVTCLLSVSVTHDGLAAVARDYVEAELAASGGLSAVDVVIVTEADTRRLVDDVLVPALALARGEHAAGDAADGLHEVVGVDGEYGRHYSFLKAIAALWHVAVDPTVRATFKYDLDQVFPQDRLVEETGRTAFGHFTTPAWGARGVDAAGRPIELGMLAGALVNERDIGRGLFTADVALPGREPVGDEAIFWSVLPQAISTEAEMMERHDGPERDGLARALERIHVTGGTNGIRVDALRRHRPFTPTFVGRAEDQAYVMSTFGADGPRLAYVHAAGLIMRHDKEAFAGDAIAAAHIGKLVGDDLRILVFSAYARAVAGPGADPSAISELLDPFTGAFVSDMPVSLAHVRLAMRALRMFGADDPAAGRAYAIDGTRRLAETMRSTADVPGVAARLAMERAAWHAFYDAIDALEAGIAGGDRAAEAARARAVAIIDGCRIRNPASRPTA